MSNGRQPVRTDRGESTGRGESTKNTKNTKYQGVSR